MNRRLSNSSLDNGDMVVCSSSGSSSPTDFTSDDESSSNNVVLMSGLPMKRDPATLRSAKIEHLTNKVDDLLGAQRFRWGTTKNDPGSNRHALQSTSRSTYGSSQILPSKIPSNAFVRPSTSRFPDSSIWIGDHFECERDLHEDNDILNRDDTLNPALQNSDDLRWLISGRQRTDGNVVGDELTQEYGSSLADNQGAIDLYSRIDNHLGSRPQPIIGTPRGINNVTSYMCARLVECRSLIDAIEFIDGNREIIDNLTRIVTTEAPAFRNYDMTSYQIDQSIKESFNPNFWIDREPVVTTADGNCQYHAVSISLTGSEAYTPEVRLATAVAVVDNREWFNSILRLIDKGTVLDLVHTISRSFSWGDETTLKAIAVAINRRIFLYTCNIGKKDYELVKSLSKEELLDAFKEKKFRGGTGIHTYADPLVHVSPNNYIMLFHKSEHFIAVLPTCQQPIMYEPYNPIVPVFS